MATKLIIYTLISVILLLSLFNCHKKGDDLRKKTAASEGGIIIFTPSTFREYVMKHPRPYDVVILFTLKFKCNLCEQVKNEFYQVADSFREFEGYKPDMVNRQRAVFFGILYYSDESSSIFKGLKLPSTTSILYTSPSNILLDDNNEPYIKYDEDFVIAYKDRGDNVYAHKILEFANAKSGRKFMLKKNPILFILYFMLFLGILFAGYMLFNNFKFIFLNPYLWLIGSFIVYIVCIGGIVYNIIHGTPFAKFNREGGIEEFIHTGQRSQYVGEGLFMSTIFVITGTVLFAFNWINKIRGFWPHKFAAIALICLLVILSGIITAVYKIKAGWYGPTFMPPYGYTKGPLIKDQGNSF
jgi:oligosaccharyltransferase complex subunit gamma